MSDSKKRSDETTDTHGARSYGEPLLSRLRLFLWPQHQVWIAGLLCLSLLGMSAYFVERSMNLRGLVDIDRASPLEANFQVDINQAELGEIVVLPGVGEILAEAIVAYRQAHGPFASLDELQKVPGIGQRKAEIMLPYLVPIKGDDRSRN